MAAGLPVFASNIPVFQEVAGSAVHYFDLSNPTSLSDALKDTYEGRITLSGLSEQGKQQATKIAHPEVYKKRLLSVYKQYV